MKKILSLVMVLALMLSLSVTAFAASNKSNGDTNTGVTDTKSSSVGENSKSTADVDVTVTDSEGNAFGKIYYVTVTWDSLEFEYRIPQNGSSQEAVWNPETHVYEYPDGTSVSGGTWYHNDKAESTANVKVQNHSNAPVYYYAAFASDALTKSLNGSTATLSANHGTNASRIALLRADEGDSVGNFDKGPDNSFSVNVSGTANGTYTVDTITVSIFASLT